MKTTLTTSTPLTRKAPGRNERKGISIFELFDIFPDEESARRWFEDVRWKYGRFCPLCGCIETVHIQSEQPLPYRCKGCRDYFSVKSGTVMHRSKIPLRKWAIAIYFMSTSLKGISSMKLHRDLKISQKSAWKMLHKIRQGWNRGKTKLSGEIEVDESYFGGKESNKHESKKFSAGRGAVGKDAVVGIKERDGKIHAKHVRSTDKETLQCEIRENVERGSAVYTDEHRAYEGIGSDKEYDHQTVKHSVGEFVRDMAHTNGIESFWALMKRGYDGTYHKISSKHLHRYVSEFMGRHNVRGMDTKDQLERWILNIEGKRLSYDELVAN